MASLIAYTRVSSETQKDNTSPDVQMARIDGYCGNSGHEIINRFHEVETASGKKRRPQFEEALNLIYTDQADGIVVYKLDRFARNTFEGLRIINELSKRGKYFLIVDLQLDTSTPTGQFILTILLAFAQLEREIISERTRSGRRVKEQRGEYAYGHPPYGWVVADKQLVANDLEQRVRALIFSWSAEGKTHQEIAQRLNYWQIPAKRGGQWTYCTIRDMIERPLKLAHLLKGDCNDDDDESRAS